jgi:hypothetical protein
MSSSLHVKTLVSKFDRYKMMKSQGMEHLQGNFDNDVHGHARDELFNTEDCTGTFL